jgi:uncharacterized protein (TIGR02466 family)
MAHSPQLDWIFAVPLFQQQLADFSRHRAALVDFLQALKRQGDGVRRSNVGGWHSDDLQPLGATGEVGWLLAQLRRFAADCIGQLGPPEREFDIVFDAVWAIINRAGDWNTPHNHMPSQWSGVCYLQVDEDSKARHDGNLIFIDPVPLGPRYRSPINVFIRPKVGGVFLFPGYLTHMVEPHHGAADRIIVSFNLQVG